MGTNIEIDEALMAEAMESSGRATKKATVEEALRQMVQANRRRAFQNMKGLGWDGDLDEMRKG